jgi:hypothetical protein
VVKHISIVACSADGTALCYRTILRQAPPDIESRSTLWWLHVAEVVCEEAVARGFRGFGPVARITISASGNKSAAQTGLIRNSGD